MNVYERNGQFLVVLGDIPQWFIVDRIGLKIAEQVWSKVPLSRVLANTPRKQRASIRATYEELLPIINQQIDRSVHKIEKSLTAKTTVAMIAVTRRCNLQGTCPHCYVDAGDSGVSELTVEEHSRLGGEIRECLATDDYRVYKINLTGGEPFFRRDILEIIRAYHTSGLGVNMSTNVMLIREEQIQTLREMDVVLSVSLDGARAETHDQIRGKGAWKKVTGKIKHLTSNGIKVGINSLLHTGNLTELEETVTLSHELGCSGFNPINLVQLGRACRSCLRRVSEVDVFKRLARHLAAHPEEQHLFDASSLFSSLGAAVTAGVSCETCGVGDRPCVYIDEIGNVYPCPNTQCMEFRLGNIRAEHIRDCVQIDHPVLKNLRSLGVNTLNEKCMTCDTRLFCGGDCRGETYNVTGNLRAPYVACKDRHDSIIELMWIASEFPEFFSKRATEYETNLH